MIDISIIDHSLVSALMVVLIPVLVTLLHNNHHQDLHLSQGDQHQLHQDRDQHSDHHLQLSRSQCSPHHESLLQDHHQVAGSARDQHQW